MKNKKLLFISAAVLPLFLSSCDIHFGSKHYDVPWYIAAVLAAAIIFVVFAIAGKSESGKIYACHNCNKTFPVTWRAALSVGTNGDRLLRCPHCGKKSFCSTSYENIKR